MSVANILYFALFAHIYLYIRFRLSLWRRSSPGTRRPGKPGRATNSPVSRTQARARTQRRRLTWRAGASTPTTLHACMHTAQPCTLRTVAHNRPYSDRRKVECAPPLRDVSGVAFHFGIQYSRVTARMRGAAGRASGRETLVKPVRSQL